MFSIMTHKFKVNLFRSINIDYRQFHIKHQHLKLQHTTSSILWVWKSFHNQVDQYNNLSLAEANVNGRFEHSIVEKVSWNSFYRNTLAENIADNLSILLLKVSWKLRVETIFFRNTLGENIADNGGLKAAYFGFFPDDHDFFPDDQDSKLKTQVPRWALCQVFFCTRKFNKYNWQSST